VTRNRKPGQWSLQAEETANSHLWSRIQKSGKYFFLSDIKSLRPNHLSNTLAQPFFNIILFGFNKRKDRGLNS
jgi:hypothetical protein